MMATPSSHAGMGAVVHDWGVVFRVWAPFADAVWVTGDFNGWSADGQPLASEGNGYWSADVPDVVVGSQYKFVLQNGGQTVWRNDPYARDVTSSVGNSVVYDTGFDWGDSLYSTPAWRELVIYELHVGTFNDQPGGGPGSFSSVIRRLDYLRDLGVNAIELLPSMEFALDFAWGYNPAHIFAVEDAYGGPEALKQLVRAAHERGIAVIFDVVYNHLGPSDLDLWRFDGWSVHGKGGIYFYNDHRSQTPWGDTRPDYGREDVRRFLADNARMWLEEFRMDGLRWDATAFIRNVYGHNDDPGNDIPDGWGLMQRINSETDARQPWKLHIAEDLRGNDWITREVWAGGAGFDTQWDSQFVHPVRETLIMAFDSGRDMRRLAKAIEHGHGGALRRVIYTESHDEVANGNRRLPEEIWPGNAGSWYSRKRSTLGAALVLTAPGIPMIFQGQEILEDAWFHDQDPIDWTRQETYGGILHLYRDLIRLRRNWYDTTRGLRGQHVHVYHVNDDDNVLAYHRWEQGGPRDDVIIVLNVSARTFSDYRIGFPRAGQWRVRFNSDWKGYSSDYGNQPGYDTDADGHGSDGMPVSGNVGIGPYSALILSQDQ
ncbi:MAG: alpha-amylase family glycosyl hydrolase [Egibacteraceae bacterium]